MDLIDQTMSRIARTTPGATRIFRSLQLDFCCGGALSLREALAEKGLDASPVIADLLALQEPGNTEKDWNQVSRSELIEHILTRYHERHRLQLAEILQLASRVESVHSDNPDCPRGLARHIEKMTDELENHMQKEEQVLFPMLCSDMAGQAGGPIMMMQIEHKQHGEELEKIYKLTNNITLPHGACNTWQALYAGLKELCEDLIQHIHLENNILFSQALD